MKDKIDRDILSRYVNNDFTPDDKRYVEQLFNDKNSEDEIQEILNSDWMKLNQIDNLEGHDLDHILHKLYYQLNHQKKTNNDGRLLSLWKTYSRVAALLLFPLALAYTVYSQLEVLHIDNEESYAEIIAPLGTRVSFSLPDGSSGWLNSGSKLKYRVSFTDSREVELSGEAYFDIIKNRNKPFNVVTSALNISVLGTQFNVAAYEDESNVDVVLESGKVRLNHLGSGKIVEMKPNEKVEYDIEQKAMKKSKVNSKKYSMWKEGKLVFRDDPFDEVAKRLSRWYNVDIVVNQTSKVDFRLRATFEDEEIEEVLRLINLTFPIDYKIEKRKKDAEGKFEKRRIIINVK